jgi:signal transduction histidine kinase
MTLRTRVVATIATIAILLAIPALYAVRQLDQVQRLTSAEAHRAARANLTVGRLHARLQEFERLQSAYAAFGEPEVRQRADSALLAARRHLQNLDSYGFGAEARPAEELLGDLEQGFGQVTALVEAGRLEAASDAVAAVRRRLGEADPTLDDISNAIDAQSRAEMELARDVSDAAATTTVLALAICMTFAALLGFWATRTLIVPITRLRRSMAAVAGGRFQLPGDLPYGRADELGDLSRSFRSMTNQLTELDQMKAEFMSIAAHELKTPINVIGGYAELMEEGVYGEVNAQQREAIISIREQAQTLTVLINELLDISRLEAGGMRLMMEALSTRELFDRVERSFHGLAEKHEITLDVELAPDAPDTIMADADRLRDQVLGNLLSNALKFTPAGGAVRVTGRGVEDDFEIAVADTGAGIPPDKLAFVFDKFYQIGEARSKGAGLGLAVAREVVDAHGGSIRVESGADGVGTRFVIRLPTRQPLEATAPGSFDDEAQARR